MFEWLIYHQLGERRDAFSNKTLSGFRKTHSTQNACLQQLLVEVNKPWFVATILIYLSKAYKFLPQELIIVEFEAYCMSKSRLILLLDYLILRKQRVEKDCLCSLRNNIVRSAPQESILGPLLPNGFINVIYMFIENSET